MYKKDEILHGDRLHRRPTSKVAATTAKMFWTTYVLLSGAELLPCTKIIKLYTQLSLFNLCQLYQHISLYIIQVHQSSIKNLFVCCVLCAEALLFFLQHAPSGSRTIGSRAYVVPGQKFLAIPSRNSRVNSFLSCSSVSPLIVLPLVNCFTYLAWVEEWGMGPEFGGFRPAIPKPRRQ